MVCALAACPGLDGDGPDPDDGGIDGNCSTYCAIEDECELRTFDDCVASACPDGGAWPLSIADGCVDEAATCGEVALCVCTARCDNETACIGSADPDCEADCMTLTEQDPIQAYGEGRCVIESSCDDIALCTGS